MSILSSLDEIYESVSKEEINAILDDINNLNLTTWEYDFVMDIAELGSLSNRQAEILNTIYKKYIDFGD